LVPCFGHICSLPTLAKARTFAALGPFRKLTINGYPIDFRYHTSNSRGNDYDRSSTRKNSIISKAEPAYSPSWGPFSRLTVTAYTFNRAPVKALANSHVKVEDRDDSILGEISELQDIRRGIYKISTESGHYGEDPFHRDHDQEVGDTVFSENTPADVPLSSICAHWQDLSAIGSKVVEIKKFKAEVHLQNLPLGCPLCKITALAVRAGDPSSTTVHLNRKITLEWLPGRPHAISVKGDENNEGLIFWRADTSLPRLGSSCGTYSSGERARLPLAREIFKHCCATHDLCNQMKNETDALDILLVDTNSNCIVEAQTSSSYLALSYVNGEAALFRTTTKNLASLKKDGALSTVENLATVIKDAMQLTKDLEERYLWVDILCIVQDDVVSKHQQIMQMDTIYRSSKLTIVNLSGSHANSPLPGFRPLTRLPIRTLQETSLGSFLVESIGPERIMMKSPYETRAWTFQERLLSSRCLYFSSHQVFFQCCEGTISETKWTARQNRDIMRHELTGNNGQGPLNPLNDMIIASSRKGLTPGLFLKTYVQLVSQYSKRTLSFTSDILNAFTGITSFLSRLWPANFQDGLPLTLIVLGLLWYPIELPKKRKQSPDSSSPFAQQFPSWSWAGWIGPVNYIFEGMSAFDAPVTLIQSFEYDGNIQATLSLEKANSGALTTWISNNTSMSALNPTVQVDSGIVKSHSLQFHAKTISIDGMQFMPPIWEAEGTRIFDVEGNQCGLFLDCGEVSKLIESELTPFARPAPGLTSSSFKPGSKPCLAPAIHQETEGRSGTDEEMEASEPFQLLLISQINRRLSRKSGFTIYKSDGSVTEPFDEIYSKMSGTWKMIIILLVRKCGEHHERVALGVIHERALRDLHTVSKKICLV
jgi:hypothetical protein